MRRRGIRTKQQGTMKMHKRTKHKAQRSSLKVRRLPVRFESDFRRVITRQFNPEDAARVRHIFDRVGRLPELEVDEVLSRVLRDFQHRHEELEEALEEHYDAAALRVDAPRDLSRNRRLLIGAYFTMEYSIASAALFNPSIVPHRNQRDLPKGAIRFILSLRATGEGHVSSVVFRTGVIDANHAIRMDPPSRFSRRVRTSPDNQYEKQLFCRKLHDIGIEETSAMLVLDRLPDHFTMIELEQALAAACAAEPEKLRVEKAQQGILWLAQANYDL